MNKFLIFFFYFCASTFSVSEEINILEVIDGDTVLGEFNGEKVRNQTSEIDAPELNQPFGKRKFCLSGLIDNNNIFNSNLQTLTDTVVHWVGW